jgi:hypothetical protein
MPLNDFSYTIIEFINNAVKSASMKPLNLGGINYSGGGYGGPPGGFVGVLPQTRVAYDYSELSYSGIPSSGVSLLDNLNHIRYRIEEEAIQYPDGITIVGTGTFDDPFTATASNIRTYTWVIGDPEIGGIPGPRIAEIHEITRIDSYITASASVTYNIEERSIIGTTGTDILTSDLITTVSGEYSESFSNPILANGSWLWLDISDISGNPGELVVTLVCEV